MFLFDDVMVDWDYGMNKSLHPVFCGIWYFFPHQLAVRARMDDYITPDDVDVITYACHEASVALANLC